MSSNTALNRHRGPFTLIGWRKGSHPERKKNPSERTIVAKAVPREEVEELSTMALTDPRDTLFSVHVWSDTEGQFITLFRKAA